MTTRRAKYGGDTGAHAQAARAITAARANTTAIRTARAIAITTARITVATRTARAIAITTARVNTIETAIAHRASIEIAAKTTTKPHQYAH